MQQVAKLAGRNLGPGNARRLNGQSSSLGLLPPTDFGGTLRSSDACGKLQSVYGGNLPQSPQRGEPQRQIPTEGNPPAGLAPQGAALRSDNSWHGAGSTLRET
ncbi:hypothetical protein DP113_22020 [Brasilonema octagenarum UFV-E1]|uniref:Uncharacterized protein n=1 Tax=Brasilonema sennae CENA114 TaxID=415709 RepID=A0A856MHT7_9CYAN|nr:hypothetical protein [Brasilonema sennae]QDL10228.1 hypothetical protein DP114_22100 [Brasilonema sennae CENA114]QDL16580.1 hypothetical protein DP113_22020 [Brasilonema octagenarum UFV-E1]